MNRETRNRLRALRPLATRDYRLPFAAVGSWSQSRLAKPSLRWRL